MKVKTLTNWSGFVLLLLFLTLWSCQNSDTSTSTTKANPANSNPAIQQKVKELMGKMSLEDKVGEMTQMTIDVLSVGEPYELPEPHALDEEKMRRVLVDLKVGSILNVGGHAYTQEYWHEIIGRIQKMAMEEKPSGIPVLYGIDAIHGTNYTMGATLFPQQSGLAATWNPEMATKMAEVSAYETRASAIPWTFSPVLDIGRDPRWSRLWEGFGEDVLLAKRMGLAAIQGYEGDDVSDPFKVASCMKHFLGYSMPWSGKDRTPAYVPERLLREYVMPTFQAAIDAGARTVMINSGEMNGIPTHTDSYILKDLLRDEMGFKGLAVSDWEDIILLVKRHRIAKDHKSAIKMAINAGVDMSMVPIDTDFPILLKELVEEGEVPMSRINDAVERILTLKIELGLFENPIYPMSDYPKFGSKEHSDIALDAALESIVLLKNEQQLLPLSDQAKVLVTGPAANSLNPLNGGWTGTWQGVDAKYNTPNKMTILDAVRDRLKVSRTVVEFVEGTNFTETINIPKAVAAARRCDVAIICLGELPYTEKPGDIDDLDLPPAQQELVQAIAATGKPIVLVLAEGRPRVIREIEPKAGAILMGLLPGNEGGRAIAQILFGDYNPNGKMPYTYPRFANTLLTYDHKGTERISQEFGTDAFRPQWPFGYGLSYTTFEYSDLQLSVDRLQADGTLEVSVKVTNTGDRDGKEVVQVYVADKVATVTPPVKRLREFDKMELKAGESKTVSFDIPIQQLAFVGRDMRWTTEPGDYEVEIGGLKAPFELVEN